MAKHLIIGLGGTGGNIICELRKRIYEEYRNVEPINGTENKVFIEYLYVDSSREDLPEGKHTDSFTKKWQTLGGNLWLSPAQTLYIGGMEREKIDDLYKYNNLNSFFTEEDRKDTEQGLGGIIGAGIGGQRRRFGRLLFANSNSQNSFVNRIQARIEELNIKSRKEGDSNENVTFHICAGLGGGTGSGTIIDAISQIRKTWPQTGDESKYQICLYLYIPEALKNEWDKGFYRPNGYAALTELNALSIGAYNPIDVSDTRDVPRNEKRISNAGFDFAYIYTDHNFADNQYSLKELPTIAADFLFHKLIVGISERFEHNENQGMLPEMIPNTHTPVHSRHFLSFGIKRLIYPETEIHEHVSYKFAYTSAMQMLWGWPKGANYPVELSYEEINVSANEIRGKEDHFPMRETLHLTDRLLTLNSDYFDKYQEQASKSKWVGFKDFWQQKADAIYPILRNEDKSVRIPKLDQELSQQFNLFFRGNGVKNYFNNCREDKSILADEVVNHIGNYLLEEWKEGNRSLAEVGKFLNILIDDCRERKNGYDSTISNYTTNLQKYASKCNELKAKHNDNGLFALGEKRQTFEQYKDTLVIKLTYQTEIMAFNFAQELMGEIIDKLTALQASMQQFNDVMVSYIKFLDEQSNEKCKEEESVYNSQSEVVKLFVPKEIRNLTNKLVHEEDKQKENTRQLVTILSGEAHNDGTHFFSLAKKFVSADSLDDILNMQSRNFAKTRLDDYAVENKNQKLLDANILELLRNESESNRKELVRKLCSDAMILIQSNTKETDIDVSTSKMVDFGLPKFPADESFRNDVIKMVSDYFEGKGYKVGKPYESANSQFVIVTGLTAIPVRYVKSVASLKQEYDTFIRNNISNYKLVHTESFDKPLPSLYNRTKEELREELYPIILLMYNIPGIVQEEENKETGEKRNAVAQKENGGVRYCYNRQDRPDEFASSYLFLSKTVRETIETLSKDEGKVDLLKALIQSQLKDKYKHNDKKKELISTIKSFIKNVLLPEYDSDTTNREFMNFTKCCDQLSENELKEK